MLTPEQIEQLIGRHRGDLFAQIPNNTTITRAFAELASEITYRLARREPKLTPLQLAGLLVKLGKYCAKRQWKTDAVKADIENLLTAILDRPDRLVDPTLTLSKIIKLSKGDRQQLAAVERRALIRDPAALHEPLSVAFSDNRRYQLVECLTQSHLKEESQALGHCAGNIGLAHYRNKMASGKSRIYSLRTAAGEPCATLEYDVKTGDIIQIVGGESGITPYAPFFVGLCQTLHQLSLQETVRRIAGLPIANGVGLTRDGTYVSVTAENINEMLAGSVVLRNMTPDECIHAVAASSRVTADLTALDLERLPPVVACHLVSYASVFHASRLESARLVDIACAAEVVLPSLKTARTLEAPQALSLDLPALTRIDTISAACALWLNAPALELAGMLELDKIKHACFPALQLADAVLAHTAREFRAPLLVACRQLELPAATRFDLASLQKIETLNVPRAASVILPKLETAGTISAAAARDTHPSSRRDANFLAASRRDDTASGPREDASPEPASPVTVDLPALQEIGSLYCDGAYVVSAPRLKHASFIHARNARLVRAPNVRSIASLKVGPRTQVDAPFINPGAIETSEPERPVTLGQLRAVRLVRRPGNRIP